MLDLGSLALRLTADDQTKRGTDSAKRNIQSFADTAGRTGQKAGQNIGDGFTRGADGKLRDAKGRLARAGQNAGESVSSGMDSGLKGSRESILSLAGKAGIGLLGVSALKTGLQTAAGMETARMGFTTMLGSAQQADVFLKQLAQFAATTPFEFPELQTAAQSLISAGVQADKVIPIMRTLGDVTAGMGTGAEGVQRATVAIQQMNAAGKITAEDLNQLRDAGIPVYDLLAAATGRSKAEVAGLAAAGKLGKTELDAMMKALESGAGLERFNGLMEKTSTSLSGLWSTLQDTFSQGMAQAIQPAIPLIKEGLGGAIAFTSAHLDEAMVAAGAFFAVWSVQKVGGLIGSLSEMTAGFGRLSSGLGRASAFLGGPWGIAIGLGVTAIGLLIAKQHMAAAETKAFTEQLTFQKGALDENSKQAIVKKLADEGALEAAKAAGVGEQEYTNALLAGGDARQAMIDKLGQIIVSTNEAAATGQGNTQALTDQNDAAMKAQDTLVGLGKGLDAQQRASKLADSATKGLAGSTGNAADKSAILEAAQADLKKAQESLRKETQKLIDKFTILRDGSMAQEQADSAWQEALDSVRASVKENGRSLDSHSEKGRANRSVVLDMITALNDKITADFKANVQTMGLKKATELASIALNDGRKKIDATAHASKLSKEEVKRMQDRMLQTPHELRTQINTPGMKTAQTNVDNYKQKIKNVPTKINTSAYVKFGNNAGQIVANLNKTFQLVKGGPRMGFATGGVLPGYTPGRDVHQFHSPTGGTLGLSGGEAIMRPEWTRAVGGPKAVERMNRAARSGHLAFASGGVYGASQRAESREGTSGSQMYGWAVKKKLEGAMKYAKTVGGPGGPVAGGGYAKALQYAKAHVGHPYIFASLWDCSGFMSSLQSIINGQSPHRMYSTPAFHGDHAQGFTRNKRSPFMVGVRPLAGKLGHMAGTLNGYNVESAGGVGVRVGKSARGWNNSMFSWRGGMADGGVIGDLPFDLLDPQGERYDPRLRRSLLSGYSAGTFSARPGISRVAEGAGAELVVNPEFKDFGRGGQRVFNAQETEQLFNDAEKGKGKDWRGSPLIGTLQQNFPASMDIRTASAVAGSMTVAKLGAIGVGRT